MMTYSKFMAGVIEVYGPYHSEILERMTLVYIKERWKESELDKIFKTLILTKSAKFNVVKPPDPAELEEIFFKKSEKDKDRELEAEALRWWSKMNSNSSYMRDCLIEDIRVQEAILNMGGWVWFSTRIVRNEEGQNIDIWNQKRFIELFKLYTYNPPEGLPRILRGESTSSRDERLKKMVFIGDREKCKQLLLDIDTKKESQHRIAIDDTMKDITDKTRELTESSPNRRV